jgi:hypothetical protein
MKRFVFATALILASAHFALAQKNDVQKTDDRNDGQKHGKCQDRPRQPVQS